MFKLPFLQFFLICITLIVLFIVVIGHSILWLEKKDYRKKFSLGIWRVSKWDKILRILKYVLFF